MSTVPSLIQSAKSTAPSLSQWITEIMNLIAMCSLKLLLCLIIYKKVFFNKIVYIYLVNLTHDPPLVSFLLFLISKDAFLALSLASFEQCPPIPTPGFDPGAVTLSNSILSMSLAREKLGKRLNEFLFVTFHIYSFSSSSVSSWISRNIYFLLFFFKVRSLNIIPVKYFISFFDY